MTKEDIRRRVSKFYSDSVKGTSGCCGGATLPKGTAAKMAGYQGEDLDGVPLDAVESSFGCGNPLALQGIEEGQTVLDLGSGAGLDLIIAAKRVGPSGKVIGVDMTDEMLLRAQRNIYQAGVENAEVRKGIIEALPVGDGEVDWVVSNCVINLSPEKETVFAEIARVLRPGGRISVSDIVASQLPDWVLENADLYSSCIAGAISQQAYCEGLRQAGLVDVEVADRLIYDADQLGALVGAPANGASSCCGGTPIPVPPGGLAELEGSVFSIRVTARKPKEME